MRRAYGFKIHCCSVHVCRLKASLTTSKVNGIIMLFITIIIENSYLLPLCATLKNYFGNIFSSALTLSPCQSGKREFLVLNHEGNQEAREVDGAQATHSTHTTPTDRGE